MLCSCGRRIHSSLRAVITVTSRSRSCLPRALQRLCCLSLCALPQRPRHARRHGKAGTQNRAATHTRNTNNKGKRSERTTRITRGAGHSAAHLNARLTPCAALSLLPSRARRHNTNMKQRTSAAASSTRKPALALQVVRSSMHSTANAAAAAAARRRSSAVESDLSEEEVRTYAHESDAKRLQDCLRPSSFAHALALSLARLAGSCASPPTSLSSRCRRCSSSVAIF